MRDFLLAHFVRKKKEKCEGIENDGENLRSFVLCERVYLSRIKHKAKERKQPRKLLSLKILLSLERTKKLLIFLIKQWTFKEIWLL